MSRVTASHTRIDISCGIDCLHCLDIRHVFGAPTIKQSNLSSPRELPSEHRDFKYVAISNVPDSLSYLPSYLLGPFVTSTVCCIITQPLNRTNLENNLHSISK